MSPRRTWRVSFGRFRVIAGQVGRTRVLLGLLAVWATPRAATGQMIMAAPHAVVVTDRARTGALTLVNTGDKPVEVSLATQYGYPVTDSAGRMTLRTFDVVGDTSPSAARWVRFFPERLVVPALGRRTVRLLVSPPPGLPNGEYWSRIVVSARGATLPVAGGGAPGIAVGLAIEVRSVLALFYRQGPVATGVQLDSVKLALEADSLVVRARLTREGSAAFVGTLRAVVRDSAGTTRAEGALPLGVYYQLEPRLALPARTLRAGTYTVTLEAASTRPDVPASALVPAETQRRRVSVVIP